MSIAPMTPTDDPFGQPYGPSPGSRNWSSGPEYDAKFEDAVMRTVLGPPPPDGIVLLNDDDGDERPAGAESTLRSAVNLETIRRFPASELPLPLDHPLRIYRSSVPGMRVTRPGGDLEGGEGPGTSASERASFARELAEDNRVRNAAHFWRLVETEKREALKELEEKMLARQDAIRKNEQLESQLDLLKEQRDLEVRVLNRRRGMGKG